MARLEDPLSVEPRYYIDTAHYVARGRPQLVLDVHPGLPEGFSLAAGEDLQFIVRPARTGDPAGPTAGEGTIPQPRKGNPP
jgi:hypothetical protein